MAAIVAGSVLYALRPNATGAARSESRPDIAVYRDQLATIGAELESGLLDQSDADTARVEISRRLLAASKVDTDTASGGLDNGTRKLLAAVCAVAVVGVSLGTYLMTGSPNLPDMPFAGRNVTPPEQQDMLGLIVRMEAHLAENPTDSRGWDLLAPIYLRMARADDAARAYVMAMRGDGETLQRLSGLGEALIQINNGRISADARDAFVKALALDPTAIKPKYFLIVAQEQDEDFAEAIESWKKMLQEAPADVPWRGAVLLRIAKLEEQIGSAQNPTQNQVREAGAGTAEERQQMIVGMVAQLAARLAEDGDDIDGWLRLIQSYAVLGQIDKAKAALADARAQFSQEEISMRRLAEIAASTQIDQ